MNHATHIESLVAMVRNYDRTTNPLCGCEERGGKNATLDSRMLSENCLPVADADNKGKRYLLHSQTRVSVVKDMYIAADPTGFGVQK